MPSAQKASPSTQSLVQQVQHNCDISDANHAGNYTLCIYLLKMREYYRWIHALDFSEDLQSDRMSEWLREKEDTWDRVVDQPYQPIIITDQSFDAFDNRGINAKISASSNQDQLFYHAGIGQKAVQHFFIAERVDSYTEGATEISITGQEYARDLTAPPAMSTANEIIVRQESLKRLCWERYQEWHWSQLDNPMGKALAYYPFADSVPEALQMMVETEQHTLIQHERGEMQISQQFGAKWPQMMLKLLGSRAELMARAVRDNLADCLSTLPFLIEQQNPAALHFYFANLAHLRKDIFPSATEAYQHWVAVGDSHKLHRLCQNAVAHWTKTLQALLAIDETGDQKLASQVVDLVEHSKF